MGYELGVTIGDYKGRSPYEYVLGNTNYTYNSNTNSPYIPFLKALALPSLYSTDFCNNNITNNQPDFQNILLELIKFLFNYKVTKANLGQSTAIEHTINNMPNVQILPIQNNIQQRPWITTSQTKPVSQKLEKNEIHNTTDNKSIFKPNKDLHNIITEVTGNSESGYLHKIVDSKHYMGPQNYEEFSEVIQLFKKAVANPKPDYKFSKLRDSDYIDIVENKSSLNFTEEERKNILLDYIAKKSIAEYTGMGHLVNYHSNTSSFQARDYYKQSIVERFNDLKDSGLINKVEENALRLQMAELCINPDKDYDENRLSPIQHDYIELEKRLDKADENSSPEDIQMAFGHVKNLGPFHNSDLRLARKTSEQKRKMLNVLFVDRMPSKCRKISGWDGKISNLEDLVDKQYITSTGELDLDKLTTDRHYLNNLNDDLKCKLADYIAARTDIEDIENLNDKQAQRLLKIFLIY